MKTVKDIKEKTIESFLINESAQMPCLRMEKIKDWHHQEIISMLNALEKKLCDKKVIKQKISKMRKIKFRVWDGNNRKFDYPDIIVLSDGLELQQFTGLTDKKGKEIYEGDIIKHYGEVWQVVFEDAMFIIKGLSYRTNFHNGESHKIRNDLLSNEVKVLEIIGNIYENKNLLEKKVLVGKVGK